MIRIIVTCVVFLAVAGCDVPYKAEYDEAMKLKEQAEKIAAEAQVAAQQAQAAADQATSALTDEQNAINRLYTED